MSWFSWFTYPFWLIWDRIDYFRATRFFRDILKNAPPVTDDFEMVNILAAIESLIMAASFRSSIQDQSMLDRCMQDLFILYSGYRVKARTPIIRLEEADALFTAEADPSEIRKKLEVYLHAVMVLRTHLRSHQDQLKKLVLQAQLTSSDRDLILRRLDEIDPRVIRRSEEDRVRRIIEKLQLD